MCPVFWGYVHDHGYLGRSTPACSKDLTWGGFENTCISSKITLPTRVIRNTGADLIVVVPNPSYNPTKPINMDVWQSPQIKPSAAPEHPKGVTYSEKIGHALLPLQKLATGLLPALGT